MDVRRQPIEDKNIVLHLDGNRFVCQNGVFMQEVASYAAAGENGVNPCFGEWSMISREPVQVSIRCESNECHFLVLDKLAIVEAQLQIRKKRASRITDFLESIPVFNGQTRTNLDYFSKNMQKMYFQRN